MELKEGTTAKVALRIPLIIEDLASGMSIQESADNRGISRSQLYRTLRAADYEGFVSVLVDQINEDAKLIESPKDRGWLRVQLGKLLYSKKTRGELTVTRHTINEERKTARLELDLLTPDEQRLLIQLQDKMKIAKAEQIEKRGD